MFFGILPGKLEKAFQYNTKLYVIIIIYNNFDSMSSFQWFLPLKNPKMFSHLTTTEANWLQVRVNIPHCFDIDFELFMLNSQEKAPVSITDLEEASPKNLKNYFAYFGSLFIL